jgi:hypothetical protein
VGSVKEHFVLRCLVQLYPPLDTGERSTLSHKMRGIVIHVRTCIVRTGGKSNFEPGKG